MNNRYFKMAERCHRTCLTGALTRHFESLHVASACLKSVQQSKSVNIRYTYGRHRFKACSYCQTDSPCGYALRQGTEGDSQIIWKFVLSEKMNPLGLNPRRFTIAITNTAPASAGKASTSAVSASGDTIIGVVQTVPLTVNSTEGTVTEKEPAVTAVELRSLVVAPGHRHKGLGSSLVRHTLSVLPPGTPVWLTTVESREAFYSKLGFERRRLKDAPRPMLLEVAAGLLAARLLAGQQLLVMSTRMTSTILTNLTDII